MGNKTIYVSEKDEVLFNEAKEIAGEALSSVIVRALREYVTRNSKTEKGMKEITVKVGREGALREQKFIGTSLGNWSGFSNDKEWLMEAHIYKTKKGSIAVHLKTAAKATLLTNPALWRASGDYLINESDAVLLVGEKTTELKDKVPTLLYEILENITKREESPVEYLDI
jgi:EXLDI family protein